MIDFIPPIEKRDTNELIEIANCKDENVWQKEATIQAKKELIKRNVSQNQQQEVLSENKALSEIKHKKELERLEKNKTESYSLFEIIFLFIFGPIIFFNASFFTNYHTIFTLRSENYFLKFKQRIIIFILSFMAWFFYTNYSFQKSEKKRLEDIEKIDISDWKKQHGYD